MKPLLLMLALTLCSCAYNSEGLRQWGLNQQRAQQSQPQSFGEAYLQSSRAPGSNGGQCSGLAPVAQWGCHYSCINGQWSSVCQ